MSADEQTLRSAMQSLMSTLVSSIINLNAAIDELVEASRTVGNDTAAQVFNGLADRHRDKVTEMQAQLAALTEDYAARFSADP